MRRWTALALVTLLSAAGAGCGVETLISDMATRLAYGVRDGASRLERSKSDTLVLSVAWRSWPDGCPGGYTVEWNPDDEIVLMCRSGKRSGDALSFLAQQGFTNLTNLRGGILGWSDRVDPSIPKY